MGGLAPLQEARSDRVSSERLAFLATHDDPKVRKAARLHPGCPEAVLKLLELAESRPTGLLPSHLKILAGLGPSAMKIAARHIATPDDALIHLVMNGYAKDVLASRKDRPASWWLEQAKGKPELLVRLSQDRSVPWFVRRRAWSMINGLAAAARAAVPEAESGTITSPSATHGVSPLSTDELRERAHNIVNGPVTLATPPMAEIEVSTETVREKLRNRQQELKLNLQEAVLIQNDPRLQRLAARHPYAPVRLLEWLDQRFPNGQARETLLRRLEEHPLDPETLGRIARTGEWELRAATARNPHLPDLARVQLSRDGDWWVRAAVAENPAATPDELARLAQDQEHVTIREHVAAHPNTPGSVLIELAGDGDPAVRVQVARNPSAPPEALARLATDARFATREAVAAHALTDQETLHRLLADPHERVRSVAALRTGALTELGANEALATRRRQVKLALANTPATPPSVLAQLAADRNPAVRAQASLHAGTPEASRKKLLSDPSPVVSLIARAIDEETPADQLAFLPRHDARVRQALSRNVGAPAPVLEDLSDDPLHDVRLAVVLNPAAPGTALERRLPEQPLRPEIRQHARYAGAVQRKLHELELQEAKHPQASADTLTTLSLSDSPRVRQKVASHVNTAQGTLLQLAADTAEAVRQALVGRDPDLYGALHPDIQAQLARDDSVQIRQFLASRSDLSVSTMTLLIGRADEEESVLNAVALHPKVTAEILATLGRHGLWATRTVVARHPLTPLSTLGHLARDPQEEVQKALLKNPNRTAEILMSLLHNEKLHLQLARDDRANGRVLEALAHDAGYARYLRLLGLVNRLPLRDKPALRRWKAWSEGRISQRAFAKRFVLAAVIEHPATTGTAVRFARRLNHPEIDAAFQQYRARLAPRPASRENDDE